MEMDSNNCISVVMVISSGFDVIVGISGWFFVSCLVVNKMVKERVVFLKEIVVVENGYVFGDL